MKHNINNAHRLCHGSLKTGPFDTENGGPFDLVSWAGVTLSEEQSKRLWSDDTPYELLCDCPSAFVMTEDGDEDDPNALNNGDLSYSVQVADEEALKREVWDQIQRRIRPRRPAP